MCRFENLELEIPAISWIDSETYSIIIPLLQTMPTNDRDILRPCLVYYLSEEMQADNGLLEALANRGKTCAIDYNL